MKAVEEIVIALAEKQFRKNILYGGINAYTIRLTEKACDYIRQYITDDISLITKFRLIAFYGTDKV